MSEIDKVAPGGIIQLNDVPGGLDDNAMFDSLFTADQTSVASLTAQQSSQPAVNTTTQGTQTSQTTQTTALNEPFLKGQKSVYKTPEAAIEGLNQKDALIDSMRQRFALVTGLDPITNQPVTRSLEPPVDQNNYATNAPKYLEDLRQAAAQSPEAYAAVQQKFIMDSLKPLAPVITSAAKSQALEEVGRVNAEIPKFVGTENYTKTLEANPDLRDAIATAESDPRFQPRLSGLYKLAYLTGQGMQLPEILKATANTSQTPSTPVVQHQVPVRTTMQNGTIAPSVDKGPAPSFKDINGIRATIAAMEAKGINLTNW